MKCRNKVLEGSSSFLFSSSPASFYISFISSRFWLTRSFHSAPARPRKSEIRYCIASYSRFLRRGGGGEKNAHSSTSRTGTTKCLPRKWTWKGLNALPRYRLPRRSLPTLRSRFHCSSRSRPRVNLSYLAAPVLTGCILPRFQTNGTLHCLPTLQQARLPLPLPGKALKRVLWSVLHLPFAALFNPLSLKLARRETERNRTRVSANLENFICREGERREKKISPEK